MADSLLNNDPDNTTERDDLFNKWKDKAPEEVLKAKVESDLYIKTLTARMDDLTKDHLRLMEESKTKAQLEDLVARQEKLLTNPDMTQQTNRDDVQPSIKPEDIEQMVRNQIAQSDQSKKYQENFNMVKAKLKEQLGDNYQDTFKQRRDSLGLTQEFADELAQKHPTVFLKTFGLDEQQRQDGYSAPRSSVRQTSFAPTVQKRDWNYYQELKKKDPRLYLDPKIAVQMHDDAIALGAAFGMPED